MLSLYKPGRHMKFSIKQQRSQKPRVVLTEHQNHQDPENLSSFPPHTGSRVCSGVQSGSRTNRTAWNIWSASVRGGGWRRTRWRTELSNRNRKYVHAWGRSPK